MAVFDLFKRLVVQNPPTSERRMVARGRATLGARVLVVDDSATIRAVLGKLLAQDRYEVLKAIDGESAIEMAQSQFPDLVFLDIVLPGISGFAVLRALRRDARTRTTPIVMMSGNEQATEQFYVRRFGADGFVKKPFGRAEVFHAIRTLVQSGRLAARIEAGAAAVIPDGMTREEWDAIPDIGLPDHAHFVGQAASMPDAYEAVRATQPVAAVVAPVDAPRHDGRAGVAAPVVEVRQRTARTPAIAAVAEIRHGARAAVVAPVAEVRHGTAAAVVAPVAEVRHGTAAAVVAPIAGHPPGVHAGVPGMPAASRASIVPVPPPNPGIPAAARPAATPGLVPGALSWVAVGMVVPPTPVCGLRAMLACASASVSVRMMPPEAGGSARLRRTRGRRLAGASQRAGAGDTGCAISWWRASWVAPLISR